MNYLKTMETNKLGMISLPKKERTALGFLPGTLVEVHLRGREIWIYHSRFDAEKNQRYISKKGTVTIPAEFRNLLGIRGPTKLALYADYEKQAFIIKA
jgi:bifunctional DNA-binding transcriptional regulator/antitoxin component of YhaV-PrlF toxin-antitoxin module